MVMWMNFENLAQNFYTNHILIYQNNKFHLKDLHKSTFSQR